MKPGVIERWEYEYTRYGTLTLLANFAVATGHVIAPTVGPTRPAEDFARHRAATIDTDPHVPWIFVMDQFNIHTSASLVRLVAERCDLDIDLGVKGQSGIFHSMPTRAAFVTDKTHRLRFVYTPKRIGSLKGIFAPSALLPASAGGRCPLASMAASPARSGCLPKRLAARRGTA